LQVTALSDLSELSPLLLLTRLRRLSLAMGGRYSEQLTLCSDGMVTTLRSQAYEAHPSARPFLEFH
jgi:hypothetical protein